MTIGVTVQSNELQTIVVPPHVVAQEKSGGAHQKVFGPRFAPALCPHLQIAFDATGSHSEETTCKLPVVILTTPLNSACKISEVGFYFLPMDVCNLFFIVRYRKVDLAASCGLFVAILLLKVV